MTVVVVAAADIVVVVEAVDNVILGFLILHCIGEAGHMRCFTDGGGSCVTVVVGWRIH